MSHFRRDMSRIALASLVAALGFSGAAASPPQSSEVVSRLFAVTPGDPYLSYSWGEHWVRLRGDRRGFEGHIDAFHCLGPLVFAGGAKGLFVSDDWGENFRVLDSFPDSDVTAIVTPRLFALEPTIFVGTEGGLYRSTDQGDEWTKLSPPLPEAAVRQILWPGPEMFVATDSGLYLSVDSGETWERLERGLPSSPLLGVATAQAFALEPTILVGTEGAGLFRSVDGGERFQAVGRGTLGSGTVNALVWWGTVVLVGTDAGLFLSNDVGDTFEPAEELRGAPVHAILIPAPEGFGSDILVGTRRGMYKSSDGGFHFRLVDEGMEGVAVHGLSTFPMPSQAVDPRR